MHRIAISTTKPWEEGVFYSWEYCSENLKEWCPGVTMFRIYCIYHDRNWQNINILWLPCELSKGRKHSLVIRLLIYRCLHDILMSQWKTGKIEEVFCGLPTLHTTFYCNWQRTVWEILFFCNTRLCRQNPELCLELFPFLTSVILTLQTCWSPGRWMSSRTWAPTTYNSWGKPWAPDSFSSFKSWPLSSLTPSSHSLTLTLPSFRSCKSWTLPQSTNWQRSLAETFSAGTTTTTTLKMKTVTSLLL